MEKRRFHQLRNSLYPPALKSLVCRQDFGRYKAPGGKMPVAFSTTAHSTGGNSGSPVMNANGELIGINFDRMGRSSVAISSISRLPAQHHCRHPLRVLIIMDKYAGAIFGCEMGIEE